MVQRLAYKPIHKSIKRLEINLALKSKKTCKKRKDGKLQTEFRRDEIINARPGKEGLEKKA
jgi:hypothetical protein